MVICQFMECKKRVSYGKDGEKHIRCAEHKLDGLINTLEKKCLHNKPPRRYKKVRTHWI